jgi:katanin p60 ATPase-containing subunit A1
MNRLVRAMATQASRRILETDTPCIVQMQEMLRGKEGVLSLAQGIVHWPPPPEALAAACAAAEDPSSCLYCADDGLPELRAALKQKLERENGLVASEVMVTAGANQVSRGSAPDRTCLGPLPAAARTPFSLSRRHAG